MYNYDFGMMFFIDTEEDFKKIFETEFVKYVEFLKKEGYIGHIGFSSHNPKIAIDVINTGIPEIMLFSINPAFDMLPADKYVFDYFVNKNDVELYRGLDPIRAELYILCEKKNIGITVMKTLGAGKLLSAEHSPFAKPLTVAQCVHYVLSRPSVASALLGCKTGSEIIDAIKYYDTPEHEKDFSEILGTMRNDFKGNCVYCSHCQPCPSQIDIATVNKYLDIAMLDTNNIPPTIKSHYRSLEHLANECILCGNCESRCPFGVPIIENMSEAVKLLGR